MRRFVTPPAGFELWDTGGGCTALGAVIPGTTLLVLITAAGCLYAPETADEPVSVGLDNRWDLTEAEYYDGPNASHEAPNLAAALQWLADVWGLR